MMPWWMSPKKLRKVRGLKKTRRNGEREARFVFRMYECALRNPATHSLAEQYVVEWRDWQEAIQMVTVEISDVKTGQSLDIPIGVDTNG